MSKSHLAFKAMNFPSKVHSCFRINDLDLVVAKAYKENFVNLLVEIYLIQFHTLNFKKEYIKEYLRYLEATPPLSPSIQPKLEEFQPQASKLNPSTKDPPKLELKPLPILFKVFFLRKRLHFLVIINDSLSDVKDEKLVRVLKKHKIPLELSISEIKGFSSSS